MEKAMRREWLLARGDFELEVMLNLREWAFGVAACLPPSPAVFLAFGPLLVSAQYATGNGDWL
jgi:hypothetical protein